MNTHINRHIHTFTCTAHIHTFTSTKYPPSLLTHTHIIFLLFCECSSSFFRESVGSLRMTLKNIASLFHTSSLSLSFVSRLSRFSLSHTHRVKGGIRISFVGHPRPLPSCKPSHTLSLLSLSFSFFSFSFSFFLSLLSFSLSLSFSVFLFLSLFLFLFLSQIGALFLAQNGYFLSFHFAKVTIKALFCVQLSAYDMHTVNECVNF